MRRFIVLVLVVCVALLVALQLPGESNAQDDMGRDEAQRAANHLSGILGIDVNLNTYAWTWEENVWATPAMGCPDPAQTYEQILTRGIEVNIYIDDVQHRYYVNSVSLIYCVDGVPHPTSVIQVVPTATPIPPGFTPSPTATLDVSPTPTPSPTVTPTVNPDFPEVMSDPSTAWEPVTQEFEDTEMVLVPAGCFLMGSNQGDPDEQPVHEICFREPYWIDKTEVTRGMYEACMEDGVCTETLESDFSNRATQPMNRLTWFQAVEYCEWREARLPTEAEWEFAARGPQNLNYPWGNEFDADAVVYAANAGGVTADVDAMEAGASWVGALNLSGNVWEWTSTIYLFSDFPYPYSATDGRENPDEVERSRVIRGGSFWQDDAYELRSTYRNFFQPNNGEDGTIGFRCARDFALEDIGRTPSPTGTPTPTATAAVCNPAMPSRLSVGDVGVVSEARTSNLNLHDNPSLEDSEVIDTFRVLSIFTVLEGPACDEENYAWYRVRVVNAGSVDTSEIGWFIEAIGSDYTIRAADDDPPTPEPTVVPTETAAPPSDRDQMLALLEWQDPQGNQLKLPVDRSDPIDQQIDDLLTLETLDLSDNSLAVLPAKLGYLPNLTSLDLSDNQLTELPVQIGLLQSLQWLDVSGNQLTELPDTLGRLFDLQTLNLSDNQLTQLPPLIGGLMDLEWLDISDNRLTYLPPGIGNWKKLESLNLSGNQLTELHQNMIELESLEWLDLSNNQFDVLPSQVYTLDSLQELYFTDNQLTELTPKAGDITKLRLSTCPATN